MTKISELTVGQGNVEVEGTIKEVGEIRSFNKFGKELSVANGILEDDSGSIRLSLWNEDASRFKSSDKIKVINGYVNEFQGEKQLTSGKFGSIEKIDDGSESQASVDQGEESETKPEDNTESMDSDSSEDNQEDTSEPADENKEIEEQTF